MASVLDRIGVQLVISLMPVLMMRIDTGLGGVCEGRWDSVYLPWHTRECNRDNERGAEEPFSACSEPSIPKG